MGLDGWGGEEQGEVVAGRVDVLHLAHHLVYPVCLLLLVNLITLLFVLGILLGLIIRLFYLHSLSLTLFILFISFLLMLLLLLGVHSLHLHHFPNLLLLVFLINLIPIELLLFCFINQMLLIFPIKFRNAIKQLLHSLTLLTIHQLTLIHKSFEMLI